MQLQWKHDWPNSQQRFVAWWNHSVLDRPFMLVKAKRKQPLEPTIPIAPPQTLEEQWYSVEQRIATFHNQAVNTYYGGDAFPYFAPYLGPGSLNLFLGSEPSLQQKTVWYNPIYTDITQAAEPVFNPANKYWQLTLQFIEAARRQFQDKALVSLPDLIENLDVLAALRGSQELLMDLIDHPDDIHRLQRAVQEQYFVHYDQLFDLVKDADGGSCFMAFEIWGPGRVAKLQCDFSAMISPSMFEEFVLPYLSEQCERLDYSLYHLDGPDAIRHLDHLLSIPALNAIQWVPGAGKPGPGNSCWYPLYERILKAGKSLQVNIYNPEQVEAFFRTFGPEGTMVITSAEDEQAADDLIARAKTWM